MDMTGDLPSNWEFFKDSWKSYAIATKLDQKKKKFVAATLLSVMGKECLHVCRNLPMTEQERQDADVILTKLNEYIEPKRNTIYDAATTAPTPFIQPKIRSNIQWKSELTE